MTIQVVSSADGPQVTVNDMLKDPLFIPTRIIDMMDQGFIADAVLRPGGITESGAVRYNESTPPYADDDAEIREEFGEVPVAQTSLGEPRVAFADERALGIAVSDRMQRRNQMDQVNRQFIQVRNTMIRRWATVFLDLLINGATAGVVTPTTAWADSAAATIRSSINEAKRNVATQKTAQGASFGYRANTLLVGQGSEFDILANEEFQKPYQGNIADENLHYTGKLPHKIQGLDVLSTPELDGKGVALVVERNTCGFIADELPLQAGALYRIEEKKTWRSDVQRASAMGLDNPKSVCVINVDGTNP